MFRRAMRRVNPASTLSYALRHASGKAMRHEPGPSSARLSLFRRSRTAAPMRTCSQATPYTVTECVLALFEKLDKGELQVTFQTVLFVYV